MRKEIKIPSIIGLIFLIVTIFGGVFLSTRTTTIGSKASGDCTPVSPQVTNITQNSADLSFITTSACSASIQIGDKVYFDIKSQNNSNSEKSIIHYFQAKNLQPQTKYNYTIISEGNSISNENYSFTTGTNPTSKIPTSNLAWGRVFNPDGKTPANAIVYLNIPGAAPLSSFVSSNGNWSISLAISFDETKTNWFSPPTSGSDEEIIVISSDGQITQVTNNTLVNNPVPDIIIGVNSLTAPTPPSSFDQSVGVGQLGTISPVAVQKKLEILNPKESESITATKPDFFGTAPINTIIFFTLDSSDTPSGQIMSDGSGNWHWSPLSALSLGEHTLVAKHQDSVSQAWITVVRKFTILTSDNSNPAYVASGSATPTIVPTTIPTDTPVPTVRVAHPSTSTAPPVTGNTLPTILIIFSAIIFFMVSIKILR